jgi:hypothetical protein
VSSSTPRLVLTLVILVAGCRPAEPGSSAKQAEAESSHVQIDTLPGGRVTVANQREGGWTPETTWRLEEDLRLGSLDAEGPEQFSELAYILTDEEGRIYVLDYPTQEIRVFSASGDFLHQIGRKGEGPGELIGAAGLDWGPDGKLWVGGARYSVFEPTGEFVTSYPRRVLGFIRPWMGGFVQGGTYVDWGLRQESSIERKVGDYSVRTFTGLTTFYPIAFTPPDGLDTLAALEIHADVTEDGQLKEPSQRLIVGQAEDGHLWVANSSEYTVRKITVAGDTLLSFSLPGRPLPVTAHEIDSTMAMYAGIQGPVPPPTRESFAKYHRLVTRIVPDNAGRIYVFPQEEDLSAGAAVDVFEESGVYLGRMSFPEKVLERSPPPHVTREHIYAVGQDEFDVPYLLRFRIVRP